MLIQRWAERARVEPSALALITASRSWTCANVAAAIEERMMRVRSDSLVPLTGGTSVEHVLDLLAAIEAGVPALMLHPRWTPHEVDALTRRVAAPIAPRALEGVLAVIATSGTTGTPKLAVLSRRALVAAARASAVHLGTTPSDRWLLAMPLAHVGGLGVVVRSLVARSPLVVHEPTEDPAAWLPLARTARVTHVSLVPTGLARLLDRGDVLPRSVRAILLGGAACPESLLERAIAARFPVHATYGLTETCGQVATSPLPLTRAEDAHGLCPLPGVELRVREGTIRVRTPTAMDGWLDAPSPFDAEGFYDTGDLGELDAEGRLTIHARRTDLVVSGGENVYPREVEDALERIVGVKAACVFGVPDVVWGQRVAAAIVADADAPSDDEIVRRARLELASFKVPRLVARLDALSLGASGKVDRARTAARSIPYLRAP